MIIGYYQASRKEGFGFFSAAWTAYWITRYNWWHCPICGRRVQLHPTDRNTKCHYSSCESGGKAHLCKGKGNGKPHYDSCSQ